VHNGGDKHEGSVWHMPRFPILRYDVCRFLLYRRQHGRKFVKLAHSNAITLDQYKHTPVGLHLAFTEHSSRMVVHFNTGLVPGAQPVVAYAPMDGDIDTATSYIYGDDDSATTTTYRANQLCQAPANQEEPGKFSHPGALHTLTMKGLQAGNKYRYRVGLRLNNLEEEDKDVVWSDEYQFTAALLPKDGTVPFSYLVYGDQGCPHEGCWQQGRDWMKGIVHRSSTSSSYPVQFVHHFGDLSYARGAAHQWDAWLDMMEVVASQLPLMIAVGNHEYCYTSVDDDSEYRDPSLFSRGVATKSSSSFHPDWGNFHDDR